MTQRPRAPKTPKANANPAVGVGREPKRDPAAALAAEKALAKARSPRAQPEPDRSPDDGETALDQDGHQPPPAPETSDTQQPQD